MKLKILILALLFPLSVFAQNRTNAFDNALINNKLQVSGPSLFKGQMIAIGPSNSFNVGFGIGVTNGSADFHLRAANAFVIVENTTSGGNGNITIRNNLNSSARALDISYTGTANNERGYIVTTGSQKLFLGAGNVEFITISPGGAPSLRFFGINTNSPAAPLHVFGQSVLDGDVTMTSNLFVNVNTTLGTNGTAIVFEKTATAALDFPSILAAQSADLTISVSGATTNDIVMMGRPADEDASLVTRGIVTSAGTVTVRANNVGTNTVDQTTKTYRVDVLKH